MADILHGSARTTPRVRAELQASKETTGSLARRYGLSRTTVAKWRSRTTTADASMGPRDPKSTVLTPVEEAMIVEFRQRTLLPLDDVLGCLKDAIPKLTRSSLHRCLERHGISRLPESEDNASKRCRFADTTIGYVHIDICELRLAEGKINMFLAIDRVSKFTYVEFHENAGKMNGADFLRNVVKAFPYKIHTVLTDNGMAFADLPKNRNGASRRYLGAHIFDRVCAENGIEHRLTKPYHPWTNGQAERMNRTIKEATVKAFHYPGLESLKAHVLAFVAARNFAKHLKALRWKTPFEAICAAWTKDPSVFITNPRHLIPGPNI
jgi:transposase-like protein